MGNNNYPRERKQLIDESTTLNKKPSLTIYVNVRLRDSKLTSVSFLGMDWVNGNQGYGRVQSKPPPHFRKTPLIYSIYAQMKKMYLLVRYSTRKQLTSEEKMLIPQSREFRLECMPKVDRSLKISNWIIKTCSKSLSGLWHNQIVHTFIYVFQNWRH